MISLTDEERQRVAAYLTENADTDEALIEQMEKLGGAAALLAVERRKEIDAFRRVARVLASIQTESIQPGRAT